MFSDTLSVLIPFIVEHSTLPLTFKSLSRLANLPKHGHQKSGLGNNFLGIWVDALNNKTYVFLNYKNNFITEEYPFLASRGTTVINDFIKRFKLTKY